MKLLSITYIQIYENKQGMTNNIEGQVYKVFFNKDV